MCSPFPSVKWREEYQLCMVDLKGLFEKLYSGDIFAPHFALSPNWILSLY
jgi:hypothetical protein